MAKATIDGLDQVSGPTRKANAESVTDVMPDPPLGRLLLDDLRSTASALAVGCGLAVLGDFIATIIATSASVGVATALRLFLLELSLFALLYPVLVVAVTGATYAVRAVLSAQSLKRAKRLRAPFAPARIYDRPRPLAAWLWGGGLAAALFVFAGGFMTRVFMSSFKEPVLASLVLAVATLALLAVCLAIAFVVSELLVRLGRALHGALGPLNPFGHPLAAQAVIAALFAAGLVVVVKALPQMGPLVPWRQLLVAALILSGAQLTSFWLRTRRSLLPETPRRRLGVIVGVAFATALILPLTLLKLGANAETKTVAISSSPTLRTLIDGVRIATDFDRDGFGIALGEDDCAPFDSAINRLARDIPDNGIDENCDGRDFVMGRLPSYRTGERMPVPEAFSRDWNVLLITVDTVRYDHTNLDGYHERKGRNTTPNLAALASDQAANFTFANAPSAGTMASIPAILTSKFFHSGIALDETNRKRGMPPRLKSQNLLISEMFQAKGYQTGAILTHEYFNDFGMEQGFTTYDNQLGKKRDPYAITSAKVTDRALAWIGQRTDKRWFLWAHYIDPHGRYVAHPGEVQFGDSEEDLYDGELAFTDKHLGRLLDELYRLPGGADRTIVVLTSDHGDAFGEHGFINHGQALYRELLHVPLIFRIPNLPPRQVDGPVSPIDIVPTLVDLCSLPVPEGHSFEGESLVPQLFYDKDAKDRIVFAETNYPKPIRAVVSQSHKLVYDLKNNLYELYDLKKDPWEQKNIWQSDKSQFAKHKAYLDDWLERVYYARDPVANQAMDTLGEFLLGEPPSPGHALASEASFDEGRIQVLGFDTDKASYKAGEKAVIEVYFKADERPSDDFTMQVVAYPASDPTKAVAPGAPRQAPVQSAMRAPGKGLLPTTRWRKGEYIRDVHKLRLPSRFEGESVVLGLRMRDTAGRKRLTPTGKTLGADPEALYLGEVGLEPATPKPLVPKPAVPKRPAPKRPAPN